MTPQKRSMAHKVTGATLAALLTGSMVPMAMASAQEASPSDAAQKVSTAGLQNSKSNSRFIITYKNSAQAQKQSSLDSAFSSAQEKTKKKSKKVRTLATGADLVQSDAPLTSAEATDYMKALAADPNVAAVEPDQLMKPTAFTPSDPMYGQQWDFKNTSAGMNVEAAWAYTRGAGVKVAVIDTGITSHPDLNSNVLPGYDFISDAAGARDGNGRDSNPADAGDWYEAGECDSSSAGSSSWHGTHVAGTIAAKADSTGVVGMAPEAKIVPVRVLGKCGGYLSDIADAVVWASGGTVANVPANANKADVINMSLGGSGTCSAAYQSAIDSAVSRGTTVVVAAGNSNDNSLYYNPGNCRNVINVAATDHTGSRAYYSNYGSNITIAAPGGDARSNNGILSTINLGETTPGAAGYTQYQGTSMATPHIAGLAALLKAAKPGLTPAQVKDAIVAGAKPFPGVCTSCGAGLSDAGKTLSLAMGGTTPPDPGQPSPTGNVLLNSGFENLSLTPWVSNQSDTLGTPADATAHSGSQFAYLNGHGNGSLYTLSQQATLPATASNATLSFWLRITTDETSSYTAYDKLTVTISDGLTTKTLGTYSNLNAGGWAQVKLPVTGFAGKKVTVTFNGKEDTVSPTSFLIDDVTLG